MRGRNAFIVNREKFHWVHARRQRHVSYFNSLRLWFVVDSTKRLTQNSFRAVYYVWAFYIFGFVTKCYIYIYIYFERSPLLLKGS